MGNHFNEIRKRHALVQKYVITVASSGTIQQSRLACPRIFITLAAYIAVSVMQRSGASLKLHTARLEFVPSLCESLVRSVQGSHTHLARKKF